MIRIGDLLFFEVPQSARDIRVSSINTISYSINGSRREMKAPFNVGSILFELLGHLEDIANSDVLSKKMLPDKINYVKCDWSDSWKESVQSWLEANSLSNDANKLCVTRYSLDNGLFHYFETMPKKAVKLSDSTIKLTRLIPGKRKLYKTNEYGNEIVVDGMKIIELDNVEVVPNIYYTITTDRIEATGQYHVVRNTCSFINKCKIRGLNSYKEMHAFLRIWKNRIHILITETI